MDELVNISWGGSSLRRLKWAEAAQTYNADELIDFNRNGITMVVPDGSTSLENKNPEIMFAHGCQWVMMNYGSPDNGLSIYANKFANNSFVTKPEALLQKKPVTFKKPAPQDPDLSFQPKRVTTPLYDITI